MFVVVGKHRKETGALGEEEEDSNHSRFRPSGGWEVGTETRASAVTSPSPTVASPVI